MRECKRLQNGALGLEWFLGGRWMTKVTISEMKTLLNTCYFLRKFQHCKLTFRSINYYIYRLVRIMPTDIFSTGEQDFFKLVHLKWYCDQNSILLFVCISELCNGTTKWPKFKAFISKRHVFILTEIFVIDGPPLLKDSLVLIACNGGPWS